MNGWNRILRTLGFQPTLARLTACRPTPSFVGGTDAKTTGETSPRRRRAALVITELDRGGAEQVLVSLAMGLDPLRWEVAVFGLGPSPLGPLPLTDVLRQGGIAVSCLDLSPRRPMQALRVLRDALVAFDPDLVQGFLFHANILSRVAVGAYWPRGMTHRRPIVLGGVRVAERDRRWHLWCDALTSFWTAGEICVSQGVLRHTRDTARIAPERLTVIPNGIDPDLWIRRSTPALSRSSLGIGDGEYLVLFVGRLDRQKGWDVFLDAAAGLAERSVFASWRFLMIGAGPDEDICRKRIGSHAGLADTVILMPPRADLPKILPLADVLVLPSRWEGMPNIILEAMASRRPIIATAVEGTEDLLQPEGPEHKPTGILIPVDHPEALRHALESLRSTPLHARGLASAAGLRVEREFALAKMIGRYDALWSRLWDPPVAE